MGPLGSHQVIVIDEFTMKEYSQTIIKNSIISEEIESKSGVIIVNNNLMVSEKDLSCANWEDAKKLCSEYRGGGWCDWRLPTKDELNQLYLNRDKIGGFVANFYWSSSEYSSLSSWKQNFTNGDQDYGTKNGSNYVRAVRGF